MQYPATVSRLRNKLLYFRLHPDLTGMDLAPNHILKVAGLPVPLPCSALSALVAGLARLARSMLR